MPPLLDDVKSQTVSFYLLIPPNSWLARSAGGISPPAAHRTVHKPLDLHGSYQPFSRSLTATGRRKKVECSSRFPGWQNFPLSWFIPFAPLSLQELQRYYGIIRPLHVHRYFPPSWSALIRFSLNIIWRVPKFRIRAQIRFTPPLHRTPHSQ